jgi:hypothetical protein
MLMTFTSLMVWKLVKDIDQLYSIKKSSYGGSFFVPIIKKVYPKDMADHKLFQDTKTGKLVEFISKHDKEFAMVRDAAGKVTYLTLDQLVPYEQGQRTTCKSIST